MSFHKICQQRILLCLIFLLLFFYLLWYQFPVTSSVQLSLQYQTLYCEYQQAVRTPKVGISRSASHVGSPLVCLSLQPRWEGGETSSSFQIPLCASVRCKPSRGQARKRPAHHCLMSAAKFRIFKEGKHPSVPRWWAQQVNLKLTVMLLPENVLLLLPQGM